MRLVNLIDRLPDALWAVVILVIGLAPIAAAGVVLVWIGAQL